MNTLTASSHQNHTELRSTNRADQIVDELAAILTRTAERQQLAALPAAQLESVRQRLADVQVELRDLQQLVMLDLADTLSASLTRAAAAWRAIAANVDTREVGDLVAAAPTLSLLNRAAVTVESAHRFSDERIALAAQIGDTISEFPHYVGQLVNRAGTEPFGVKVAAADNVRRLLKILTDAGAIRDFGLEARVGKPVEENWVPVGKVYPGQRPSGWRVTVGTVDAAFRTFLQGHWLTAYAYGIARDQFGRADNPVEIYSNVTYRLPGDLGGGASDIDVLVRIGNHVMCIECKSGRVLQSHRGQATPVAHTVTNAAALDSVLSRMGADISRSYHLLYLPTDSEPVDAVAAAAAGDVQVEVLTPRELRAKLAPAGALSPRDRA